MKTIDIIGIGQGLSDLTAHHMELINQSEVLVGGQRMLDMFDTSDKITLRVKGKLSALFHEIKGYAKTKKVVVLASGDPLFHGIGASLTRHFDKSQLNIHPNISSIGAAFAAIKEPWHDARLISLHGREPDSFEFNTIEKESKIAFLTDPKKDPHYIADWLIKSKINYFKICVLEKLGHAEEEKIQWFDNPDQLAGSFFTQPNIVILKHKDIEPNAVSRETHIGMKDERFRHQRGLITKSEIRAVTLAKLRLSKNDHVLWDIGAGSGSVSIEAAILLKQGEVFAVEQNSQRIADIIDNCKRFNCNNISVINAVFPSGIETFDSPDRIFIGGGGKDIKAITNIACQKLLPNGVIVINTVLLQTMDMAVRVLEENRFTPEITQLQVSRSKSMPFGKRMEALNPVWIISGSKPNT